MSPFLPALSQKGRGLQPTDKMNPLTLRDLVVNDVPPLVYAGPGGEFANLNSDKLEEERLKNNMSRGELASEIGVSRSTIRGYEEGADVSLDMAAKLEDALDAPLFEAIDLSTKKTGIRDGYGEVKDPILSLLSSIGFDVLPTKKAPFRALSETDVEKFLTGIGEYNRRLKKKASIISSLSGIVDYKCFMIVDEEEESKRQKIKDTPLLTRDELDEKNSLDELLALIKERA